MTIYETVVPGASVRRSRIGEGPKRPGAHRSVCTTVRVWATGLAPEGETGQMGPRSRRRPPLPGASAAAVQLARSQGRCLFGHIVNKAPRKGSSSSGSRSSGRAVTGVPVHAPPLARAPVGLAPVASLTLRALTHLPAAGAWEEPSPWPLRWGPWSVPEVMERVGPA